MRFQRLVSTLALIAAYQGLSPSIAQGGTIVRMETNVGSINIELFDDTAPITVGNFLNYLRRGEFDNSFIHRSAKDFFGRPFVIQGGGYTYLDGAYEQVPQDPPIANEFDPNDAERSNTRGTIAMAKLPSGPDTATSEWFFNISDNSANLDAQNGGFTVFGRVFGSNSDGSFTNDGTSMQLVDAIAGLDTFDGTGLDSRYDFAWTEIPVFGLSQGETFDPEQHLIVIRSAREVSHLLRVTSDAGNSVALTVPLPARLANLTAMANPDPANSPAGVSFDEGFFSFEVTGLTAGGSVAVALQLPEGSRPNTYYMYGPTPDNASPHWYEFKYNGTTGAEFFGNNHVVLHFVDGQRGDADLTENGQISDPGAPGVTAATSDSSGGGCTLNTAQPNKVLDHLLMALMLIAYAAYNACRKHDRK